MRLALVAMLALATLSCERPKATRRRVDIAAPATWTRSILVVSGAHWIDLATSTPTRPSDGVDASAGAVTAFLDRNGNGRLDVFAEPSAACVAIDARWSCGLAPVAAVSYRIDEIARGAATKHVFVPMLFDANDGSAADFEACVGDEHGCAADWRPVPWTADIVEQQGRCEVGDAALWIRTAEGTASLLARSAGEPLSADMEVEHLERGGLRIHATSNRPTQRQVVWLERAGEWLWSTELAADLVRVDGNDVTISIPGDVISACVDCSAWLSLATHGRRVTTTGAALLDVAELRVDLRASGYL